jgi:hypothetical protein
MPNQHTTARKSADITVNFKIKRTAHKNIKPICLKQVKFAHFSLTGE